MKAFTTVMKVLAALAAVVGAVYVVATYGDKIVAWAKKMLGCCCAEAPAEEVCECECDETCECTCACEETPAEEAPAAEEAVVAEEADFEG